MTDNTQISKEIFEACMKKDEAKIRQLFAADYKLTDPIMKVNGIDEMLEMIKSCPSDGKMEDLQLIAQGDKVAATFTSIFGDGQKMRMCSIMTFKGGKLSAEEMFYDTTKLPQEMKDMNKAA